MNPHDLGGIMRLESSTPEAPHWPPAVYERFLSAKPHQKRIFVAEEGGRLLGFAAAQIILDACELDSIAVDVTARRSGVGRTLLAALFDWVSKQQIFRVQLEVRDGNKKAIAFYLSSGFTQDGCRPAYYHDPDEAAVLMSKTLE
jgi:[ribosomal protein S18]-alanine N-acetyltransferase